jgi:hypothetical protein
MTSRPDPRPQQVQPARPSDMVLRLQIGIGGVLAVLLLVGLASMIGERAVEQATGAAAVGEQAAPPKAAEADQPLIDLGVQPANPVGATPPPGAANAAPAAAPAAGAAVVTDLPAAPPPAPPAKSGQ